MVRTLVFAFVVLLGVSAVSVDSWAAQGCSVREDRTGCSTHAGKFGVWLNRDNRWFENVCQTFDKAAERVWILRNLGQCDTHPGEQKCEIREDRSGCQSHAGKFGVWLLSSNAWFENVCQTFDSAFDRIEALQDLGQCNPRGATESCEVREDRSGCSSHAGKFGVWLVGGNRWFANVCQSVNESSRTVRRLQDIGQCR